MKATVLFMLLLSVLNGVDARPNLVKRGGVTLNASGKTIKDCGKFSREKAYEYTMCKMERLVKYKPR